MTAALRIPFVDLRPDADADARAAIDRVIARGWFVLGPEVEAFDPEEIPGPPLSETIREERR